MKGLPHAFRGDRERETLTVLILSFPQRVLPCLPPLSHRSLAPLERPRPLISTHVYPMWRTMRVGGMVERKAREREGGRERERERGDRKDEGKGVSEGNVMSQLLSMSYFHSHF